MKKKGYKFVSILLSLVLIAAFATFAAGCGHEHTYAETPSYDATHHWYAATCEHEEEVKDKAVHTFDKDHKCTVCDYAKPHTFAQTWSSDETNHWHAATCGHTSLKDGLAAHEFNGRTCNVCDYQRTVESKCKCETPCEVCPDCGGCIYADCTNDDCPKCGDGLTSHEYLAWQAVLKGGTNPLDPNDKWDLNAYDHSNCTDPDDFAIKDNTPDGIVIQGVQGNNGGSITFTIVSDKSCMATLRINSAKNESKPYFTDQIMLLINGEIMESKAHPGAYNPEIKNHKCDYGYFIFGCIQLKEGENTIVFQTMSPDYNTGYNMCCIDVMTAADVNLTFTPTENTVRICGE